MSGWIFKNKSQLYAAYSVLLGKKKVMYNDKWVNSSRAHAIVSVCVLNNRASKYSKEKLIELHGGMKKPTLIVTDFHIPLSIVDNTSTQKIKRYRIIEQHYPFDVTDIYR